MSTPKRGTPKPPAREAGPITVRLPSPMVDALDVAAAKIRDERPEMMTVSRADAIRVLLAEALSARKIPIR